MTKSYIVSGHGGCFSGQQVWLPANVEIRFYCGRDQQLGNTKAYTILTKLWSGREAVAEWVADSGKPIPAYSCWRYPQIGRVSGVFRRKTRGLVMDLSGTSGVKPVRLTYIADTLSAKRAEAGKLTVIHWLACTDVDFTGNSSNVDYQEPPRLHSHA